MNILDENIPKPQRELLERHRIYNPTSRLRNHASH